MKNYKKEKTIVNLPPVSHFIGKYLEPKDVKADINISDYASIPDCWKGLQL